MKVHLFDTISGLYEGESFESDDMLEFEKGLTAVAPPQYGRGQVPVYDAKHGRWTIVSLAERREILNTVDRGNG